jgi:hypothetical protein
MILGLINNFKKENSSILNPNQVFLTNSFKFDKFNLYKTFWC